MKIIHITPSYKPAYIYGGPIISVAKLCEVSAALSLDVQVLTTKGNGKTELTTPRHVLVDGVKVQYFRRITKDHTHFSPALLWKLYKMLLITTPFTVIHIHSWWNLVSMLSCLLAKIKKAPVVLSPRGMLTPYTLKNRNSLFKQLIHLFIGRHLISYCTIHATTEKEQEDILKIVPSKNVHIIPNLVYLPLHENLRKYPDTEESAKPFKLLFLSRIEEKKGLELLFLALANCQFPWSLTIAGTGKRCYQDKLKQLACDLGISQFINWIGYVEKENKYNILACHQLLVLFSYNENFANIVLESLSVGTAVAISNKVGLADFVKEHKLGWTTDLDPKLISQVLTNASENPQAITRIRKDAPQIIRAHFNEESLLKEYLELYKTLN